MNYKERSCMPLVPSLVDHMLTKVRQVGREMTIVTTMCRPYRLLVPGWFLGFYSLASVTSMHATIVSLVVFITRALLLAWAQ